MSMLEIGDFTGWPNGKKLGVIGAILGIIGPFLTWIAIDSNGYEWSASGMNTDAFGCAGWICFLFALFSLALLFTGWKIYLNTEGTLLPVRFPLIGLLGLFMLMETAMYVKNLNDIGTPMSGDISIGIGLWLSLVSALILLAAGLIGTMEEKKGATAGTEGGE